MSETQPLTPPRDRVVRAMTNDGAFRIITARTLDTARAAVKAQDLGGDNARIMAELITAAVLFRETMAPGLRVQAALRGAHETGQMVADSHPDGWNRALIQQREARPFDAGPGALMQMMRTMPNKELNQGVVEVPAGGTTSDALMAYLDQSEQVQAMVRVCAVLDDAGELVASGGYIVQVLPEAPDREGMLLLMAQRIEDDFMAIGPRLTKTDSDAMHLVHEIFWGMEYTELADTPIEHGCDCSRVRVLTSLSTLSRQDIDDLLAEGEPLDITCEWCGTNYRVEVADLRGLQATS